MTIEQKITAAETEFFAELGVTVEQSFIPAARSGLRLRVLEHGDGPALVFLHGVSMSAAAWAPLFALLPQYRSIVVDLPGHGLSEATQYQVGHVRADACAVLDDVFDAFELTEVPVVGHSLGAMFALWHAASGARRISSLVAIGDPAVALPGVRVKMPLSLLTVPVLGRALLRAPSPAFAHRRMLAKGLGAHEVATAPDALLEALRLSARRPGNARTIAGLMHAIDHFTRPRPESTLSQSELAALATPTTLIWGSDDPYLTPADARPAIEAMPAATLHEVAAGHGPWLVDPKLTARLVTEHLEAFGEGRSPETRLASGSR